MVSSKTALFKMQQTGITSLMRDRQLIAEALRKCSKKLLYEEGKRAHGVIFRIGYESDLMLSNDLIDMYRKCSKIEKARYVFDGMPERNVVSWAALMCGYLHAGNAKASLSLLNEMGFSDVRPNEYILSTSMKACSVLGALESGKQIHALCSKTGLELCPVVGNSIIDMYFKCRKSYDAEIVFDKMPVKNLITWNAMISGYTLSENTSDKSLHFLKEIQKRGENPDEFTFSSGLKACRNLKAIREGKQIHAFLIRHGYSISTHKIIAGALIDLYAQCGRLFEAHQVFNKMEVKSLISWSALMVNYARRGHFSETMNLFRHLRMSSSTNVADSFVLSSLINVFSDFAMVGPGKQMHAYVMKIPYALDVSVINSILDMYLKCGLIEEAERLFNEMVTKNVVSYTVMITGYGKNGLGEKAVRVFEEMGIEKIRPDLVTYLAVLSACSHSGLVEESQECFKRLCDDERVEPRVEHYACMVDVLGRAGRLKEAKDVIEKMPVKANVGIWQTLLNACRMHKNVEVGSKVGDILLGLDGENLVNYVLVSNMFADVGYWKECERLWGIVKAKGLKKDAGYSLVEMSENSRPQLSEFFLP